jgi:hypothetical protein
MPNFISLWSVAVCVGDADDIVKEYYSSSELAILAAKGRGYYNSDAVIETVSALRVEGQVFIPPSRDPVDVDLKEMKEKRLLRENALQKLTQNERKALGL